MITGKELAEKLYSVEANDANREAEDELHGIKNYKNGSLHVIFEGNRPINNDFNETLSKELIEALDKFFEECSVHPLTIDVFFNIRLNNKD